MLYRDGGWLAPSLCSPSVLLQLAGISWKGAYTHIWYPNFCGSHSWNFSRLPASDGQQGLHLQARWDCNQWRKSSSLATTPKTKQRGNRLRCPVSLQRGLLCLHSYCLRGRLQISMHLRANCNPFQSSQKAGPVFVLFLCCAPDSQYFPEESFKHIWCPSFYIWNPHFCCCQEGDVPLLPGSDGQWGLVSRVLHDCKTWREFFVSYHLQCKVQMTD